MNEDLVVTKSELLATHRQQVRPRSIDEAVQIFAMVLRTYNAHKITGPITVHFSQGGIGVMSYDEIVRIPKGSQADKATEEIFSKRALNNVLT